MSEKLSLVAKIARACDAVGGIEKGGYNQKQGYKYLKASDVAKAIRHEFFSRGVIMVWDDKDFTQIRTIPTQSGGQMGEFLLKSEITFLDGDSTEKLGPFGAFGVAMDTGDKSIWKCRTGALKYALRTLGMIPDEKDDPEADENVDAETTENPKGLSTPLGNFQKRAWESNEYDKTPGQRHAYLLAKFGQTDVTKLSKPDFDVAIKWLVGKERMEDTLKTSVEAMGLVYKTSVDAAGKRQETHADPPKARTLIPDPEAPEKPGFEKVLVRVKSITARTQKPPKKGSYLILECFNDEHPENFDIFSWDAKINEQLLNAKGKLCIFEILRTPKGISLKRLVEVDRLKFSDNNEPILDADAYGI
jgi:hypothetical protein